MAVIGIVVAELHIGGARSLKEKRRVVRSLVERLHQRHRVSIGETGFHDKHQRAEITLALVGARERDVERHLDRAREQMESNTEAAIASWHVEILEMEARR